MPTQIPAKDLIPIVAAAHFQKSVENLRALATAVRNENQVFWSLESWRNEKCVLLVSVDLDTGQNVDVELFADFVRFYFPRQAFDNRAEVEACLKRFLTKLPAIAQDMAVAWPEEWRDDGETQK